MELISPLETKKECATPGESLLAIRKPACTPESDKVLI